MGEGSDSRGEPQTGEVLAEKNSRRVYPIASVTKLMTAAVAFENYALDDEILITPAVVATGGVYGGLRIGEKWRVDDLLHALLLESSNDAGEALASKLGRAQFFALMNEKAKLFGMRMRFYDPTGLSLQNGGSADDLAKLVSGIFETAPWVFQYTHTQSHMAITDRTFHYLKNLDGYAGQEWFVGGKTGYLTEVGKNYAGIFLFGETPIAVAMMGAPVDTFTEVDKLIILAGEKLLVPLALPNYCSESSRFLSPAMSRTSCLIKPEFAEGRSVEINLSNPKMRLYKDGKLAREYWMSKVDTRSFPASGIYFTQEKLRNATINGKQVDYAFRLFPEKYMISWPRQNGAYVKDLSAEIHSVFGSREAKELDAASIFNFVEPNTPIVIFE